MDDEDQGVTPARGLHIHHMYFELISHPEPLVEKIANPKDEDEKEKPKLTKRQLKRELNKNRIITIKDVDKLPFELRYRYDQRGIFSYI